MADFKYAKLRGRIIEKFGSLNNFAKHLGVTIVTVSRKLNGKSLFSSEDIVTWCKALDVPLKEAGPYFFT